VLDCTASRGERLEVRFAALVHDLGKGTTPPEEWPRHIAHEARSVPLIEALCERLRVPISCRELALAVARVHTNVHRALELRPQTLVKLLEGVDFFRRPERLDLVLRACECDARGRAGLEQRPYPQADHIRRSARAAAAVDAGAIARATPDTKEIPERIRQARIAAVRSALNDTPPSDAH
jgi:tRNA nucleotidyltransferase (CCA-adding enzyme)